MAGAVRAQADGPALDAAAATHLRYLFPEYPAPAPGAPRDSDVLFSPRFERPETLNTALAYGATRLEWSYISAGPMLTRLVAAVPGGFVGAINNNAKTAYDSGVAIDFDGKPTVAPWMRTWSAPWNSCVAPPAMQALLSHIDKHLAAGATGIQFDDAGMQFDASFWGVGDFSSHSLRGFKAWLEQRATAGQAVGGTTLTPAQAGDYKNHLVRQHQVLNNDDYIRRSSQFPSTALWRSYLAATVQRCVAEVRAHIKSGGGNGRPASGRASATLSINVYTPFPWTYNAFLLGFADYVASETALEKSDFEHLLLINETLRAQGLRWAPVFPIDDVAALRLRIATTYAVGGNPLVPWDVYIPDRAGVTRPRFFGPPEALADLFRFVRRQPTLFEGWQTLSRLNLVVDTDPVNADEALAQASRLARLHVPYAAHLRKAPSAAAPVRANAAILATLQLVSGKTPTTERRLVLSQKSDAELAVYAAVSYASPGLQVVVKGHPEFALQRVVHVVQTGSPAPGAAATVRLVLRPWVLPADKTSSSKLVAKVHSPGATDSPLANAKRLADDSLEVVMAAPTPWSVLELSLVQDGSTPVAR